MQRKISQESEDRERQAGNAPPSGSSAMTAVSGVPPVWPRHFLSPCSKSSENRVVDVSSVAGWQTAWNAIISYMYRHKQSHGNILRD